MVPVWGAGGTSPRGGDTSTMHCASPALSTELGHFGCGGGQRCHVGNADAEGNNSFLPAVTAVVRFLPRLRGSCCILLRDPDLSLRVSAVLSPPQPGRRAGARPGDPHAAGLPSLRSLRAPQPLPGFSGVAIFISLQRIAAFLSQKAPCILIKFLSFFIQADLVLMVISLEKHAF